MKDAGERTVFSHLNLVFNGMTYGYIQTPALLAFQVHCAIINEHMSMVHASLNE